MAALAGVIGGGWDAHSHADGGSPARSQTTAAPAPNDSGATAQARAQQILRALANDSANNWVRYWQARAACQAAATRARLAVAPLDRVLLALTTPICAQLDARLSVNPSAYPPRGDEQSGGLLLNEPGAAAGYTLFIGLWHNHIFLIDPLGIVAHAWHLDSHRNHAKLLDNGNLFATDCGTIFEYDPLGNQLWQYSAGRRIHHDFLKMPNGNALMIVQARKPREEVIAAGANPDFVHENGIKYDYLLEARPAGASGGEIVWRWSPWDRLIQDFDPTKPNYGAVAEHPELIDINFPLANPNKRQRPLTDWLHTNSLAYNPELDQIMLSPRHFSELWIIDRSATTEEARGHTGGNAGMGGALLYRWGNPRAYGQGDIANQRLFWQHMPHWIPPGLPGAGNILAFNNGNEL